MATYTTIDFDISTGEVSERDLTDAEIIAGDISYQIALSADKLTIANDGVDSATVTVQLVTAPLSDDTQENITNASTVTLSIDGEAIEITLDSNGSETIILTSVDEPTTIVMRTASHLSNTLNIEVTDAN